MIKLLPSVLLALFQICASDAEQMVHEKVLEHLPTGWKFIAPASETTQISLSIALNQDGLEELRKRLDATSDPSHEHYGAHLSRDEVRQYRSVPEADIQAVVFWLQSNEVVDFAVEDAWVRFNATVGQINQLLSCNMSSYHVAGSSETLYRAWEYSLPEELLFAIDYIFPVTQFMTKTKTNNTTRASQRFATKELATRGLDKCTGTWDELNST